MSRRRFLWEGAAAVTCASASGLALLGGCGRTQDGEKVTSASATTKATAIPVGAENNSVRFTDVTKEVGLDFMQSDGSCGQFYFVEQVAAGAALFDSNGDGFLDIYFPQPKALGVCTARETKTLSHRLYRNDGKGHFRLDPNAFGGVETDYGIAAGIGDFDNNGHPDLYVAGFGQDKLFRNRGDGTFEDVTARAGVGVKGFSTGAVWFDYDGDGRLDLFVSRYCLWDVKEDKTCEQDGHRIACDPKMYPPATNLLFHNNGDGTFTDVSHKMGIGLEARRSLGAAAVDFDGDGKLELFVANDMGPNFLYKLQPDGTFRDVAMEQNIAFGQNGRAQANMGVAIGDYDENGTPDILVTTFENEPYTLYRNDGFSYTDTSAEAGIAQATLPNLAFGAGFLDTRNLGRLDLFFANGHVNPAAIDLNNKPHYKQANQLLLNDGKGRFTEAPDALPASDIRVHRGACFGDFNNDGRIDMLVTATNDRPTLLRNDTAGGNWLLVKLKTATGCATPIGTRCIATFEGKKRLRFVLGGGSYGGESDHRVHFGLGSSTYVETLEIHWMSGKVQTLTNIAANQILNVQEA